MEIKDILAMLPKEEGSFDPCYAFSIHKCGSTMMHSMVRSVANRYGIPGVSVPTILFNEGILEKEWTLDPTYLPAFERRLLYFGFRNLPNIFTDPEFKLKERRFVLLVRDPRDALVSAYFSFGRKKASHALPSKKPEAFLKRLEAQPERDIDTYVLQAAQGLLTAFQTYRDNLNFDLGLVRRYEDVFYDKETFLGEIFQSFRIDVPGDIIRQVAMAHDIRPDQEDESKHIRKGTPGDHAEKLQPDTVRKLNDTFRDVAAFYGYSM